MYGKGIPAAIGEEGEEGEEGEGGGQCPSFYFTYCYCMVQYIFSHLCEVGKLHQIRNGCESYPRTAQSRNGVAVLVFRTRAPAHSTQAWYCRDNSVSCQHQVENQQGTVHTTHDCREWTKHATTPNCKINTPSPWLLIQYYNGMVEAMCYYEITSIETREGANSIASKQSKLGCCICSVILLTCAKAS